uniref:Rx N-terminal domain-containing protein n=1 Tax=Setaria italica TaxID=4555 RepID=K3ZSR7_SETIT
MANMVSSAVVHEAVSQILSDLINRHEGKEKSKANENLERLEMAHIKLEAALETSEKWQITGASLLRWRKKLKRAAQECDDTLHRCKNRILEEEQIEQEVRNSAFPKRIAHATRSLISSAFGHDNQLRTSIVRRFEWYADGAGDFLRFIELGCTPHCHMPFNPFIKNFFAGKKLQHKIDQGNGSSFFILWLPFITAEHRVEVSLVFIQKDGNAPENNFYFSIMLQLSESTDIVGIAMKCLQLFTPLFKSKVEVIRNKIMKLPAQDFSWVPFVDSRQKEHWDNLWLRPDPSCCKKIDQHEAHHCSNTDTSDVSLEPVIEAHLECQVSLDGGEICLQDSEYLIAGLLFMPHGSSENLSPGDKSSAIAVNHSEEQHCMHRDITLTQLEEITLAKAVEYFRQNTDALVYQMLWKSKQGTAYIHVVKGSTKMQSTRRMIRGGKIVQQQERDHVVPQFLNLWVGHAPIRLQGSIVDWIQKEGKNKLAFSPLRLKL